MTKLDDRQTRSAGGVSPSRSRARDAADDAIEIADDLLLGDAKHAPPELSKVPIPRSIVPLTTFVIATVNLDDDLLLAEPNYADSSSPRRSMESQ